jgi:hypothetical protein
MRKRGEGKFDLKELSQKWILCSYLPLFDSNFAFYAAVRDASSYAQAL